MATGTIILLVQRLPANPYWTFGIIGADGTFYDYADQRWITAPAPRNGQYVFSGYGLPTLSLGQKVSFTPHPGTIDVHGANEVMSSATDVQPA